MGNAGSKPGSWCELVRIPCWPQAGLALCTATAQPALPRGLQLSQLSSHQWFSETETLETFTMTHHV